MNTPETDKAERMAYAGEYMVPTEVARKLERELIYLEEMLCHARKLERERDEAREMVQQMSESNQVLMADTRFYRNAWEKLKEIAK